MMLAAWGEFDDVAFECKEFEERNRGTDEQVVADLTRLGSQLSRLGKSRVSSQHWWHLWWQWCRRMLIFEHADI